MPDETTAALRAAADEAFARNPGGMPAPEVIARIRMRLYPCTVSEESP